MKIVDRYYTGSVIKLRYPFSPKGPSELNISEKSAFWIHRKRTRDEFKDEGQTYQKRAKHCEIEESKDITSSSFTSRDDENVKSHFSGINSVSSSHLKIPNDSINSKVKVTAHSTEKLVDEEGICLMELKNNVFTPYSALDMQTRSEFYDLKMHSVTKNNSGRGRKRASEAFNAKNMNELIHKFVVPEWEAYLVDKKSKEDFSKNITIRSDAVWKKILRDCREFFRILFKNRFHRMDYQSDADKVKCIVFLLKELGFPEFLDTNIIYSYSFFHQIHMSEK